jgi:hypothetical protein
VIFDGVTASALAVQWVNIHADLVVVGELAWQRVGAVQCLFARKVGSVGSQQIETMREPRAFASSMVCVANQPITALSNYKVN